MKSLRCKFDNHDWIKSEDGMEWICKRCKLSCHDVGVRSSDLIWFCSLSFLRSLIYYPLRNYIAASDNANNTFTDNKVVNRTRILRIIIVGSAIKFMYEVVAYVLSTILHIWQYISKVVVFFC